MDRSVLIYVVACCILQCRGLEFTLNRDVSQDGYGTCGILLCEEESHTASNTSVSSDQGNTSTSTSPEEVNTISRLAIYRIDQSNSTSTTKDRQLTLIAAVNTEQADVMRVSGDMEVEGHLTTGRASLKLVMVRQEDCQAEFTCQVRAVDSQGREAVETSNLLFQPSETRDQGVIGISPQVTQLLALVQEMTTNLSLVGQSVLNLESDLKRLENKLDSSVDGDKQVTNQTEDLKVTVGQIDKNLTVKANLPDDRPCKKVQIPDQIESCTNYTQLNAMISSIDFKIIGLNDAILNMEDNRGNITSQCLSILQGEMKTLEGIESRILNRTEQSIQHNFENFNEEVAFKMNASLRSLETKLESELEQVSQLVNKSEGKIEALLSAFASKLNSSLVSDASPNSNTTVRPTTLGGSKDSTTIRPTTLGGSKDTTTVLPTTLGGSKYSTTIHPEPHTTDSNAPQSETCRKGMTPILSKDSSYNAVFDSSQFSFMKSPFLCDTLTDGGGWIVIQRRTNGDVDFNRDWATYKKGFGNLTGDFWMGNDAIYKLTSSAVYELRVYLKDEKISAYALYDSFYIGDEQSNYVLRLGSYSGTAGDSLSYHNGMQFSTYDDDNDEISYMNCAQRYTGGWWFKDCYQANLNGKWGADNFQGPAWLTFFGSTITYTEMKIRLT